MNEHITKLLLTYPKKEWKQKQLVLATGYSKGFISQEIKKLLYDNIVSKLDSNIVLIDFPKLLNKWVGIRKLPKPIYFKTTSIERLEDKLKKSEIKYALTLFRAAWHRIKFLKIERIELYVIKKDLEKIRRLLGKENIAGNIEVYLDKDYIFVGNKKLDGLCLVSPVQNYVDLMCVGGSGTRVALQLAKKYKLGV